MQKWEWSGGRGKTRQAQVEAKAVLYPSRLCSLTCYQGRRSSTWSQQRAMESNVQTCSRPAH
jgi:hypothetical protein